MLRVSFTFLLACRDRAPLGMNSGYIATSQLTSSKTYDATPQYHISQSRLAIKLAAWRVKDVTGGWIQVLNLVFQYFTSLFYYFTRNQIYIFVPY